VTWLSSKYVINVGCVFWDVDWLQVLMLGDIGRMNAWRCRQLFFGRELFSWCHVFFLEKCSLRKGSRGMWLGDDEDYYLGSWLRALEFDNMWDQGYVIGGWWRLLLGILIESYRIWQTYSSCGMLFWVTWDLFRHFWRKKISDFVGASKCAQCIYYLWGFHGGLQ
jgi:hypothetical protein